MSFRGRGSHTSWYSMRARGNPDARYTPYPSRNSFYTQSQQQQLGQFVQDHSQQQPEQLPDQQPYFQGNHWEGNQTYDHTNGFGAHQSQGFNNSAEMYYGDQGGQGHGQFDKQHMTQQNFEGFPSYDGQHQQQSSHHRRHAHHDHSRSRERSSSSSHSSSKTTCLYCDRRLRPDDHDSHCLSAHWELEFHCGLCPPPPTRPKHFSFLRDALKHLENAHKILDSSDLEPSELTSRGLLRLPVDLRALRCRLCKDKHILAQDRMSLSAHVRHSHRMDLDKQVIRYNCRICTKDFGSGLEFSKHPCCLIEQGSAQISDNAEIGNPEIEDSIQAEVCFFCDKIVPKDNKASHKGKHWAQEFQCANGSCIKSFTFYEDFLRHAEEAHQVCLADLEENGSQSKTSFVSGKLLSDRGLVLLPKDLRCLICPYCSSGNEEVKLIKKFFLGQDRASLVSHIKRIHPGYEVEKSSLTYYCRSCKESGFASSSAFLEHPCCEDQKKIQQNDRMEEGLLDVSNFEWDESNIPDGDLRRLVCLICRQQFNGTKFFNIIDHLESTHRKFQLSRSLNLESFVGFGCGHCKEFQTTCTSVRTWDHHFVSEDFKVCGKMAIKLKKQEQELDFNEINQNDIRRLTCKLCNYESNHLPYKTILTHIRSTHPTETDTYVVLDSFVNFGCAKCSDFSPKNNSQWSSHFYKCNTRCRLSYQREQKEKQEEDQSVQNQEDLRKLDCKICELSFKATGFRDLVRHLEESHGISGGANTNLEDKAGFGCSNCPNFAPDSLMRWDRHFSQDFLICQGSGKVCWSDKKILYWCDVCMETRENVDKHFINESHKRNLDKLVKEKMVEIFRCDVCDVAVTTQANYDLHVNGDYHNEAAQKTMANV